jgi:hypothetical protein
MRLSSTLMLFLGTAKPIKQIDKDMDPSLGHVISLEEEPSIDINHDPIQMNDF